jgi:FKBP-type peptidyl-prolyl cis-trans isomerase
VAGEKLVDHRATLGRREVIAGVERSLMGMKAGGYRKVRVSPHLAYREKGLPGLIPENAVLVVELWLREILHA